MKKLYVKPAVEVCEILPYSLLAGSDKTKTGQTENLENESGDDYEYKW